MLVTPVLRRPLWWPALWPVASLLVRIILLGASCIALSSLRRLVAIAPVLRRLVIVATVLWRLIIISPVLLRSLWLPVGIVALLTSLVIALLLPPLIVYIATGRISLVVVPCLSVTLLVPTLIIPSFSTCFFQAL